VRQLLPPAPDTVGGLVDQVYIPLRDAIVAGDIPTKTRLREVQLAQHYGVSSTPVREALRRLEFDGLIELLPRRGALVAAPDLDEISDLYATRAILERAAARAAASLAQPDVAELQRLLGVEGKFLDESGHREFSRRDLVFHRALSDLGGNQVLAREAERLHRQIQAVRSRAEVRLPGQPRRSHEQHIQIVRAVRERNPDKAEKLVEEHITGVKDAVLSVIGHPG